MLPSSASAGALRTLSPASTPGSSAALLPVGAASTLTMQHDVSRMRLLVAVMAYVCQILGYRCLMVVSQEFSDEQTTSSITYGYIDGINDDIEIDDDDDDYHSNDVGE